MKHIGIDVHKKKSQICVLADGAELAGGAADHAGGRAALRHGQGMREVSPNGSVP
jgi:hypothetical protein